MKRTQWIAVAVLTAALAWPTAAFAAEEEPVDEGAVQTTKVKAPDVHEDDDVPEAERAKAATPDKPADAKQSANVAVPDDVPEGETAATPRQNSKPVIKIEQKPRTVEEPEPDYPDEPEAANEEKSDQPPADHPGPDDFIAVEKMPVEKFTVAPQYPVMARLAEIEGDVWVQALVDKEGRVRDVFIAKPSGHNAGFEEAAIETARQARYTPAEKDGEPVAVWITYKVEFRLD